MSENSALEEINTLIDTILESMLVLLTFLTWDKLHYVGPDLRLLSVEHRRQHFHSSCIVALSGVSSLLELCWSQLDHGLGGPTSWTAILGQHKLVR